MMTSAFGRSIFANKFKEGLTVDEITARAAGSDARSDCHLVLKSVQDIFPDFNKTITWLVHIITAATVHIDTGNLFAASSDVTGDSNAAASMQQEWDVSEIDMMTSQVSQRMKSDVRKLLSSYECVDVLVLRRMIELIKGNLLFM